MNIREAAFQAQLEKLCFARLGTPMRSGLLRGITPGAAAKGLGVLGLTGYLATKLRRVMPPQEQPPEAGYGVPLESSPTLAPIGVR